LGFCCWAAAGPAAQASAARIATNTPIVLRMLLSLPILVSGLVSLGKDERLLVTAVTA
jgi:hypothetical protein